MNDEIKNVQLSFCCKENWQSFATIDERTRFCGSCKHRVIDFTQAKKKDLVEAVKGGQRVCGRFSLTQVNQALARYAAASLVITSTLTAGCSEETITPPDAEQQAPVEFEEEFLMGDIFTGIIIDDSVLLEEDSMALEIKTNDIEANPKH